MIEQNKKFEQGVYKSEDVKVEVTEEGCIFCFVPKTSVGILCDYPYKGVPCEICPLKK